MKNLITMEIKLFRYAIKMKAVSDLMEIERNQSTSSQTYVSICFYTQRSIAVGQKQGLKALTQEKPLAFPLLGML